jgi:hypothetical protein
MDRVYAGPTGSAPCGGAACTLRIEQLSRALEAARRQLDEAQQQHCAAVYNKESAASGAAIKREHSSSSHRPAPAKRQKTGNQTAPSRWEVFVGNIPGGLSKAKVSQTPSWKRVRQADDNQLRACFFRFGVTKVDIPNTRAGQYRYAIIAFSSYAQQQQAIREMHGSAIEASRIEVMEAAKGLLEAASMRHDAATAMSDNDTFLAGLEGTTASIPQAARSTAIAWNHVPRHGQGRILKEEEIWEDENLPPNACSDNDTKSKKSLAIRGSSRAIPQSSTPAIQIIDPRPPCKSLDRRELLTKLTNHQRRLLPFGR